MNLNEEELERTNMIKTMIIEPNNDIEDDSILEEIEVFEDKIDYLDIEDTQKDKLKKLCEEIKKETDENARNYLFKLLQKEMN